MKKTIIYIVIILVIFALACAVLFNFNKKSDDNDELETVRLAEVAHSIFYAPMYVAIEE